MAAGCSSPREQTAAPSNDATAPASKRAQAPSVNHELLAITPANGRFQQLCNNTSEKESSNRSSGRGELDEDDEQPDPGCEDSDDRTTLTKSTQKEAASVNYGELDDDDERPDPGREDSNDRATLIKSTRGKEEIDPAKLMATIIFWKIEEDKMEMLNTIAQVKQTWRRYSTPSIGPSRPGQPIQRQARDICGGAGRGDWCTGLKR
ncbi:hypothetical protein KVT40_009213 [Elsinoe batatas]|uniref:Uncharacterized protein n=1 Tax=Elsinoe batatas TaxID=2601811 RepID=A0A8K0KVS2_9PEZI|nr:hypothetical protein KVT40_009213 [Elsinoe batatas]